MSKKPPKIKINKKSIRVIRKTLGAICLITAIIVAAIPIPELEAIGGAPGDTSVVDIVYSVSDNPTITPLVPGSEKIEKAYTIYQLSNGKWLLDWLYEYYIYSDSYAVISKYNSNFTPTNGSLNIDVNVIKAYPQFKSTEITEFFSVANSGNNVLADEELQVYYPLEYGAYLELLKAYNKDPVNEVAPTPLDKRAKDLSTAQKYSYFCEHTEYTTGSNVYSLKGYTLVEVTDKTPEAEITTFIPRMGTEFFTADADKDVIMYIGDKAFENATKITNLTIPSEVQIIGNSAFKNASGIKSITVYSTTIGNHAFQGCSSLTNVTIQGGTTVIGTEAFRNCNSLQTISLPYSIEIIGEGAFANCGYLRTADMSGITRILEIDKFAFYDCYALNTVKFCSTTHEIQDGVFAVKTGVNGTWTSIVFPDNVEILGDFVLSGRSNLKDVTMPSSFGIFDSNNELGSGFFRGCINLNWVNFPDNKTGSCGYASFETNTFIDVLTPGFYIRGPEKDPAGGIAYPRLDARAAAIPYVYIDEFGKECYEAGNGSYLYLVDADGYLQSCSLIVAETLFDGTIEVPSAVGDIKVIGIAEDCFNNEKIYKNLKRLIINDDSVTTISDGAFKGYPALEYVQIGNSVKSIGANAFADCTKLTEVHFNTPKNGYSGFTIGVDAFATTGDSLIFYGDINSNYAPFTWAMEENNFMDPVRKIRVCYKSNAPTKLTVMRDNVTGLVTLVDYPHYEQIDENVISAYEAIFINGDETGEIEISADDIALVKATLNISIPAGIQSIDTKAYMAAGENYNNCTKYLYSDNPYYSTYKNNGLFNGYYGEGSSVREYPNGNSKELVDQGNDRIQSITMVDVEYLPANAFYSCENLQVVSLGNACADIGVAPFAGCTSLGSIAGNTYYSCVNGIIYSNNADDTKNIVECLSGRGLTVGEKYITVESDPFISKVTTIAEGAFQDCTGITRVDLSTLNQLKSIPKTSFDGCSNLRTVMLPDSITEILVNAFTNTATGISVTIPGKEMQIDNNAFDYGEALIRTYKNTAAATYAKTFGHDLEIIDDIFTVYFLDYDSNQLGEVQYIESGKSAKAPADPTRTGYNFTGWSQAYNNIIKDTIVIALYTIKPTTSGNTTTPGNTTKPTTSSNSTSTDSVSGNALYQLTVESGSGDGSYKKGIPVIIKADAAPKGKVFDKWMGSSSDLSIGSSISETTTIIMPAHEVIMIASYKDSTETTTGSNSGSTTVSGNGNSSGNNSSNGTTVAIDKSGISNKDMASASVEGSTDNYIVKISDSETARQAVEAALLNEYGTLENISYFAMDISLYDSTGTTKITDTTGIKVNITMPIPDDLIAYAGNNKAASVVNDKLDKMTPKFTAIDGVSCITFTATHFSPYTIYVDTANLTAGITDRTPKTGDGIHPKWFLALGLICLSAVLFLKKDKEVNLKIA